MFDRKLIEGFVTDLDLNEVLHSAVKGAAELMASARERTRHTHYTPNPLGIRYSFIENPESKAVRMMAKAIMTPYRAAFEMRTEMERSQAQAMVRVGAVKFLEVACAGETCDSCNRPLWQHVRKWGAITMCPFGREYWMLARAIVQGVGSQEFTWHYTTISEIAKSTHAS